jgi:murein L,D-transpeptidase YcbB/YkuD
LLRQKIAALANSSSAERAKTDLLLSYVYTRYVRDLHQPAAASAVAFTDAGLQPGFRRPLDILGNLAKATSARAALDQSTQMNPLYVQMRTAYAHRPGGDAQAPDEVWLKNLDRLRGLPSDLGPRFVLVNAASSRLWMFEGGKPVDSMKVVVGAKDNQTPQLAALIRYAIFNPYWDVPPDLTRKVYAPRILSNSSALASLHMDAWTDFSPSGTMLDPKAVNWRDVTEGKTTAWLRQRPGPANAMGAVKFMLPNALGIYLHDTPNRGLFGRDQREFSAGCVRVEDAKRLSRWLYGKDGVGGQGAAPEQRIDLPQPVPVYILYLTVAPQALGNGPYRDPYDRDRPRDDASPGKA